MATLFEKAFGEHLIDGVIFGKEDAQRALRIECVVGVAGDHRDGCRFLLGSEDIGDAFAEFSLAHWLEQVGSDAEFLAAGGIAFLAAGGEHHDGGGDELWPFADMADEIEAVHLRHVHVGEDETEGVAGIKRGG